MGRSLSALAQPREGLDVEHVNVKAARLRD